MLQTRDSFGGRWHEVAEFTVCGCCVASPTGANFELKTG